jgi:splicing factor 3B subunit 3
VPAAEGKWASAIRILDLSSNATKGYLELGSNEAAFSITTCRFAQHSEEVFIIVGTTVDLKLAPRKVSMCYINVYRNIEGSLQHLHRTEVEEVPYALTEFQGKLLVGIGRSLRLYDLGKKKLLKKCENKSMPSQVVRLACQGDRIYVADLMQSVIYVKYRRQENILSVFADDTLPR